LPPVCVIAIGIGDSWRVFIFLVDIHSRRLLACVAGLRAEQVTQGQ